MTPLKLTKFTLLFALFHAISMWIFDRYLFTQVVGDWYILWLLDAVCATALIRRLGLMNYLEFYYVAVIWIVVRVAVDAAYILTIGSGWQLANNTSYLWGYGVLFLAIALFHKKKHVGVRRGIAKP